MITYNMYKLIDYIEQPFPASTIYTELNCWDWSRQRAEMTIALVKDAMDNNEGNRLTEDFFCELYDRLTEDYYYDVYVPERVCYEE